MYIRLHTGTHESGDAIIQVEDTGHGIPTEISDRVLEPFFTTKPIGQGTGLGLSVCHFIVENAGGSLTLESTDSGTTVTIRLPAASHLAEDIPIPEFDPIDPSHEQIRVLVVDDEPAIAHLLSDMLEDYSVVAMSSGSEAISLMETKQFDVLVCDLMMPDVSGIDVYHFLQSRGEQDRVIFLTGGAFSPASRNFLSNISNLVIRKPFIRDQIRRAVANLNQKTESIPLKAG